MVLESLLTTPLTQQLLNLVENLENFLEISSSQSLSNCLMPLLALNQSNLGSRI